MNARNAALWTVLSVTFVQPGWAQTASESLRFEVASIKPRVDVGTQRAGIEETPNLFRIENLPLDAIIRIAYGVASFQLAAPGWTAGTRFDIEARPPAGYTTAQRNLMLRNLLADRFKLQVHREKRLVTGYALRVAAGGHKLPAATGERSFFTARPGLISGTSRTVTELVNPLTSMAGGPVVDETGLTGAYNLKLEWTPDTGTASTTSEVSLFTALREQMGLRLEPSKVAVEVVVVDSVERTPTEN